MPTETVSILEKESIKTEKVRVLPTNHTSSKNLPEKEKGCIQMLMGNNTLENGFKGKCQGMESSFGTKEK